MNVVVCGASGYIGSVLTPELLRVGADVTAADMKLGPSLREACRYEGLTVVKANCLDLAAVESLIKGADFIYWLVGATSGDEKTLREINVSSALRLANKIGKGQTIVFPQTNAGYRPTDGLATEETPMVGISVYSQTKIEAEKILMDTGRCVSFRLAAVYGPAPTIRWETLLNNMIYHAVRYPDRPFEIYQPYVQRDVLFTNDLVNRLLFPLEEEMAGEVFNLSSHSLTKMELLESVFMSPEFRNEPRRTFTINTNGSDPDQRNFSVSEEKLHERVGHVETTDLDAGIAMTIKAARLEV